MLGNNNVYHVIEKVLNDLDRQIKISTDYVLNRPSFLPLDATAQGELWPPE
jgi:hypothetical protein